MPKSRQYFQVDVNGLNRQKNSFACIVSSGVNRHRFGADPYPDPTFQLAADQGPTPSFTLLFATVPVYIALTFLSAS
jgi:hypothetical protein